MADELRFTLVCGGDSLSANSWANVARIRDVARGFPGDHVLQATFTDGTVVVFPDVKVGALKEFVAAFHSDSAPDWKNCEPGETRYAELAEMGYSDYLQSPEWTAIKKRKRRQAAYRCQVCNASGVQLDVHHRTYENRGHELDEDLIVLCHECHGIFERAGKLKVEDE